MLKIIIALVLAILGGATVVNLATPETNTSVSNVIAEDTSNERMPIDIQKVMAEEANINTPEPKKEPVKVEQKCHSSYSGCLNPDASDYDCEGGSGNGPYYTGAVQVYGYDEYDLDRDNDGWACE